MSYLITFVLFIVTFLILIKKSLWNKEFSYHKKISVSSCEIRDYAKLTGSTSTVSLILEETFKLLDKAGLVERNVKRINAGLSPLQ